MNTTPSFNAAGSFTSVEVATLQNIADKGLTARILLGKIIGANMNSTSDQPIVINSGNYIIRNIVATNASISLSLAIGGVYAASSKTTPVVANTQVFSALTASSKTADLTLNALGVSDKRTETTLYLSLTTGQGVAATADLYIFGDRLD